MDLKPYVLVLSDTSTKPKSLIKLITKSPSIDEESDGIIKHNWFIDTKYYTAEVSFFGIEKDFDRSEDFNLNVEGLVIHLDTNKESGLNDLKVWENIERDCDPEVKILVTNYCNDDTKVTKTKALEWCLKRNFELVELYPTDLNIEPESDLLEKVGAERVIEALLSHTWSNLNLKVQKKKIIEKGNIPIVKPKQDNENNGDSVNCQDESLDDFSEIFSQLQTMRESLNSLPVNQRKHCAEQMVTAFWKAIGGDEEELSDL